ncbi:uncharacterized protein CG5098 [Chrysoperla carnea]|uniref:uncharacterized protein CG5098 n=1 Tax=Chrysoperla carnea TaxID=189513 RepID=UPI001D080460|nr:uncharacterized protein CG5098 [Chrysoperla carnea]
MSSIYFGISVTLLTNVPGVDSPEGSDVLGKGDTTYHHGIAVGSAAHSQQHDWGNVPLSTVVPGGPGARVSPLVITPGGSTVLQVAPEPNMPGGPHSQHGRPPPVAQPGPPGWNHLQVSSFYAGRQPQHAHMSSDHHLLAPRPPTWHTPSTDAVTPLFSLQQMLGTDRAVALAYPRPSAATVDLSLPPRSTHSPRNGNNTNQNGESSSSSPISLSVRDAKQINSLAERRQSFQELVNPKRPKRVDSILERLNTGPGSVIVTAAHSSHDESSNSSQPGVIASSSPLTREEEVLSPASNEDSLDSAKSRRKRKPLKTIRMSKDEKHSDEEKTQTDEPLLNLTKTDSNPSIDLTNDKSDEVPKEPEVVTIVKTDSVPPEKQPPPQIVQQPVIVTCQSNSEPVQENPIIEPPKTRRKTLSESETIENIAAMIASTEHDEDKDKTNLEANPKPEFTDSKVNLENMLASPPPDVSSQENNTKNEIEQPVVDIQPELQVQQKEEIPTNAEQNKTVLNHEVTDNQKSPQTTNFVEVENQLEKMFAGLEEMDTNENTVKHDEPSNLPIDRERVTSTSSEVGDFNKTTRKKSARFRGGINSNIRRPSEGNSSETTPTKKTPTKDPLSTNSINRFSPKVSVKLNQKTKVFDKSIPQKMKKPNDNVQKDIYAYDSGSNTSSIRSRGPFIQIRGPRDSPISVNIVNTPSTEDDAEKTQRTKAKKSFHDDSEYRNKVRSKGLHSSTLSIKYDAHTTDTSWICVFCKRGPHTTSYPNNHQAGPSSGNMSIAGYSSGDLFGPYIITSNCPEYQESLEQISELKMKLSLQPETSPSGNSTGKFFNKKAKKRHLQSWTGSGIHDVTPECHSSASLEGMLESSASKYEIWAHEDCIVWGPGVYLAGPRIVGLEGAVWSCCSVVCEQCQKRGANVSCLVRNCGLSSHVGCAKLSGWNLNEETYKAYCQRHKKVS